MNDCSNCNNSINANGSHACKVGNSTYLISDYPAQGVECSTWNQGKTQKLTKEVRSKDPLVSWLSKFKKTKEPDIVAVIPVGDEIEQKAIEYFDKHAKEAGINIEKPQHQHVVNPVVYGEVNFKYALGWIVAAVFGGVLVSIWLLGLLK
jgi:hypothetical protein